MKRFAFLIGIMMLLALPAQTFAKGAAISDAVDQVIQRSQRAIIAAKNPDFTEDIVESSLPESLRDALSTVLISVTTKTSVVEQERSLAGRTTCFRFDLWVIEQEIDRVWTELDLAEQSGKVFTILHLQDDLSFLNNQYDELLAGGLNPERKNKTWDTPMLSEIDEEDVSNDEPTPFCFFHSSYTPPNDKGYGCGIPELDRALSILPTTKSPLRQAIERERDALQQTQTGLETARRGSISVERLRATIDTLVDGGNPDEEVVVSTDEASSSSTSSAAAVVPIQGCVKETETDITTRELRGPFSIAADEWRLLRDFWQLRGNEGSNRPLPDGLQLSKKGDQFLDIDLNQARAAMQEFMVQQAREESAMFASTVDPGLALRDAFHGLSEATSLLTHLGGSVEDGLPAFARGLALWLRRSCTDRIASDERLDTILKISLTQECFPYGSGDDKKATCEQPQWKQCLYAALHPDEEIPDEPGCPTSSSSSSF